MEPRTIDLRSDAVTRPTEAMYRAMREARLGDDAIGIGGDPMVTRLEQLAAQLTGKEAALFLPSGAMANLVALLAHTKPGDGVIAEASSHILTDEAAAVAEIARLVPHPVETSDGRITRDQITAKFQPRATLLCLENTHNRHGGTCMSVEETRRAADVAHAHQLKVHLDGARIYNAAVAMETSVMELAEPVDSVMFCLTKGLCCPVGSVLAGSSEFIAEARRKRKQLGGAMHQAGLLAACGIVALETMIEQLNDDHQHARILAEGVAKLTGVKPIPMPPRTNIVLLRLDPGRISNSDFVGCLAEKGILCLPFPSNQARLVTHHDVSREDVLETIRCVEQVMNAHR